MSETKPTTYQEALEQGPLWVFEDTQHDSTYYHPFVALAEVSETEDDFAGPGEDQYWWCHIHFVHVLSGGNPYSSDRLGGVRVDSLRLPYEHEILSYAGALVDREQELLQQLWQAKVAYRRAASAQFQADD